MSKYKTLFVNIFVFALNTIATRLITFFLVPLYTYYLSQGEYGVTDIAQTLHLVIIPVVTLSLSDAVLRFAIEDIEHIKEYFSIGTIAVIISSIIVFLLLPLLDLNFFGGLGRYKFIFFLVYLFGALQVLFSNMARALNKLKLITIASVATSLITCGTAVLFIVVIHLGVSGFLLSMVYGYLFGCLIYFFGGKLYCHISLYIHKSYFALTKQMLIYSIPLVPNAIFWWIGSGINRFFITGMIGVAASGLYAASSKIPNILNTIYNIFQQAWTLSSFQEYRNENIVNFFNMVFRVLQSVMAIVSALFILLSQFISSFMLQNDFFQAWVLMPLIIFAVYANSLNSFWGSIFTASMKTRNLMISTVIGGIACILLTWILIPICGLWGACIANVVSNFIVLFIRIASSKDILQIKLSLGLPSSIIVLSVMIVITSIQLPNWFWLDFCLLCSLVVLQLIDLKRIISFLVNILLRYR